MVLKIGLQRGMTLYEFLILYQRWVAAKLLGNLVMAIEKLIEASELLTTDVVIACVFSAIITIFLPHEIIWIFFYFFAYARMVLQKGLQFRMPLYVILIVHERRIAAKLLGNFLVAVQKLIKARQFLACNVAVWRSSALLR